MFATLYLAAIGFIVIYEIRTRGGLDQGTLAAVCALVAVLVVIILPAALGYTPG